MDHIKRRYFLTLAYDGTPYQGWQRQSQTGLGIQAVVEDALRRLFNDASITLVGGSRTDAGVHAAAQVAHADLPPSIHESELPKTLNRLLPATMALTDLRAVSPTAHARYDAVERQYEYAFHTHKTPFKAPHSLWVPYRLDADRIEKALEELRAMRTFASFCKGAAHYTSHACRLTHVGWRKTTEPDAWCFELHANRFLRGMVRALVGALLDVGRGKKQTLNALPKSPLAPPHGLCLRRVVYPNALFLPAA